MKNYDLSASCNTIEKNSSFVGNFNSESDFRIDGSFEGNIETKGKVVIGKNGKIDGTICLLYTSPSPRDKTVSRMPSSA